MWYKVKEDLTGHSGETYINLNMCHMIRKKKTNTGLYTIVADNNTICSYLTDEERNEEFNRIIKKLKRV